MNGKDAVKAIMSLTGTQNSTLASRLGLSQAAAWGRLNNKGTKDISVSILVDMLRVMDYKVVVMPSGARVPDRSYVVDGLSAKKPENSEKTEKEEQ